MENFLFELEDDNGVKWAGKMLSGKPWLVRKSNSTGMFITVRELLEDEVEEYQRMAGCYPRA